MSMRIALGILIHLALAGALIALLLSDGRRPTARPASVNLETVLDDLLEKQRARMSQPPGCLSAGNPELRALYFKGRLLTAAYPEILEGLLLSRAGDPTRSPYTRAFAVDRLGELYRSGRTHLEPMLHGWALGPDRYLRGRAIAALAEVDATGRFLDLYRANCTEQGWEAFEAVSCWVDQTTVTEMERIVAQSPGLQHPECELRLEAEEVLARLRILSSPDCDETLLNILDRSDDLRDQFSWALKVGRRKQLPGLLDALRRRLQRVEYRLPPDASEAHRHDFAEMERLCGPVSAQIARGESLVMQDRFYDAALIAYAELGGVLNDAERRRLTLFGFVGDPKTRLEEMLNSGQ
jgi:hypothetical protein